MNKYILIVILSLSVAFQANSQYNFKLVGEGMAKQVKLLWLPEKWYEGMDGVVIKRREISTGGIKSDWITLSQTTIHPGNWLDKDLTNVSNSAIRISDLQKLRTQFFNNSKAGTTQMKDIKEDYLKKELAGADGTKSLILMFAFDYDMALIMGFGYVDAQYPKSELLEYGIFPVINGNITKEAVKTFEYHTGIEPDLSFIVKKSSVKRHHKVVNFNWSIDTKNFGKKNNLIGFNVYRKSGNNDYIKITNTVIWINNSGDENSLVFSDTIPDEKIAYSYGIAAVSIFKNESKKYETVFQPQNYIDEISPPALHSNDNVNTDYINQGVNLEWTFKSEQESAISGFIVERKLKSGDPFSSISSTLPPSTRKYHDNAVPASQSEHYFYRVNAVRKETYPICSDELILFYNPKNSFARPKNFTAEPIIVNNSLVVHLKWSGDQETLKSIQGYTILCDRAWETVARESELPLIKGFEYNYKIEGVSGAKYLFAVAPVDKDGVMSESSDTVSVMIPTQNLPTIRIWPIETIGKKVVFEWKYPNDINDLEGFRIYQNGALVANELQVNPKQRKWSSSELIPGKYTFQIEAITKYKILSKKSTECFAIIK